MACRYYLIDAAIALNAAFFVNAAILILSAAVFHRHGMEVATIEEAFRLLPDVPGQRRADLVRDRALVRRPELDPDRDAGRPDRDGRVSPPAFGPVASPSGHPSDRPGSGGRGHLVGGGPVDPASLDPEPGDPELTAFVRGDSADPLHVEPEEHGEFATPWWGQVLAWSAAAVIVALNGKLVLDQVGEWVGWAANRRRGSARSR